MLPVLRKDLPAMEKVLPGRPVVFDTNTIPDIPTVSRKVTVHRWMIENVLPRVNKGGLVSRVKNYGLQEHDTYVDIDQAVQEKWLVYDLTHYRDDTADKPNPKYSRPEESAALAQILAAYPPLTPVFGWGAVDENTFVRVLTEKGLVVICSGVPNNSFYNRWKATALPLKQKHVHVADSTVKVENKIYLAFMVNKGDSIKNAVALQGHGAWIQPERGSVPINWGVEPAIFERYSGLMEYFYKSATPNDYFFTAPAGWGYAHPNRMTPEMAKTYVNQTNKGFKLTDTDYIDIWWIRHKGPVWDAFARGLQAKGLTQWYNPEQKVGYKEANFPVIYGNHYYTLNEPEKFAQMLMDDYKKVDGPWFVIVYGANRHLTPYKVKAVMDRLPADRFKAVLLDEFFTAARKARDKIEGRVWRPGPNAPKGVAP
jgi:GxGYxYP putative glycoside hydrolase C-terminal domain